MTIGDFGFYISSAGCSIGGFGGGVNSTGSAPATLAITFGSGIVNDGVLYLVINGVQYSITIGNADTTNIGAWYTDGEGGTYSYNDVEGATFCQQYIESNFSASLTVSRVGAVVTLTTVSTTGATLSATCSLPMFPIAPLGGASPLVGNPDNSAVVVSGAGTAEANGLYSYDGAQAGRTKYTNAQGVSIVWNGVDQYLIRLGGTGDIYYQSPTSTITEFFPWSGPYTTGGDGSEPVPTVRQATLADGAAFQRLNEQFEAPGATGWSSITTAGYAAWDDEANINTGTVPILGNYSALISSANVNRVNAYKDFAATGSCYMRFQFYQQVPGTLNDQILCSFLDAGGNVLCSIGLANTTGRFRLIAPGATSTTVGLTQSEYTNYYGWLEYEKGTGSNAVVRVGWSTSPNRPNWPGSGISGALAVRINSTSTSDATRIRFGRTDAAVNYNYVVDDIQIQPVPFE